MKREVKKACRDLGFKGKVNFAKASEWGLISCISVHRRLLDTVYDVDEACEEAIKNNFPCITFYLEVNSYYKYRG